MLFWNDSAIRVVLLSFWLKLSGNLKLIPAFVATFLTLSTFRGHECLIEAAASDLFQLFPFGVAYQTLSLGCSSCQATSRDSRNLLVTIFQLLAKMPVSLFPKVPTEYCLNLFVVCT